MIPTRRLLHLLLGLAALAGGGAFVPAALAAWKFAAGLLVGVALLDLLQGRRVPALELRREVRRSLPLGVWSRVGLRMANGGRRTLHLRWHDHHPPQFAVEGVPGELELPAGAAARVVYRVRPDARGDVHFTGTDLFVSSPLGLWYKKRFQRLPEHVRVFPNFREVAQYALLATDHRLSQIGIRQRRRRGEGSDFQQLREYRGGDSLRQIDWKATSRYRKLISKEYQDERDQQLVFLLDCGRRMRHAEGGRAHLDQVLNAMLLLAYVAARQGDAVGFMAFGGNRRWCPPRKGGNLLRDLLFQTYDLESSVEAADYLRVAQELMPLQRKRALLLMLTNTRDEDDRELRRAVQLLARRHLVLIADLREAFLDATLLQPVRDLDAALRFHAVNDYLSARSRRHESLLHQGARVMDLRAEQLPVALVNQYLTIKASGAL